MDKSKNLSNQQILIDALLKTGSFGKYQKYIYALVWIPSFLAATVYIDWIFVSRKFKYRCLVSSCESQNSTYDMDFLNMTTPWDAHKERWDQCYTFPFEKDPSSSDLDSCSAQFFDHQRRSSCSESVFQKGQFESTTFSEFGLTCNREWLASLAGSLLMAGMLVGSLAMGEVSDRFGRRRGMVASAVLLAGGGVMSAVSVNYVMFLAMKIITGAGGVGLFQAGYVIAMESVGVEHRSVCGVLLMVPFALGEAFVGVLAYFIRDWRWLQVATTVPSLFILTFTWFMPESIRWLISKNRKKEAIEEIVKAYKMNEVHIPEDFLKEDARGNLFKEPQMADARKDLNLSSDSSKSEQEKSNLEKRNVLNLLRTPNMRNRSLNLFFCWIVCTIGYFGLASNSGSLGGNIFINFIGSMLIEIPSYALVCFILDRTGRKGVLVFMLLIGGTSCIAAGMIPKEYSISIIITSLIGKFGMASSFSIIFIYSTEIFPTEYRSIGLGACSMCARIGGIIAPQIANLAMYYASLPVLIFGGLAIVSGFLITLLPETGRCDLPQTLEESEQFGRDQPVCYFLCCSSEQNSEPTENASLNEV